MFAERFAIEFLWTITQTVDPRIETETDPQRQLEMFTTHLEVKGRFHIYKTLSLLKGKVCSEGRKRMQACYLEPMNGLEAILK